MAEQNKNQCGTISGCLGMMKEMMRNMMSGKDSSRCAEKMAEMMPGCCSPLSPKEAPIEGKGKDAPR